MICEEDLELNDVFYMHTWEIRPGMLLVVAFHKAEEIRRVSVMAE